MGSGSNGSLVQQAMCSKGKSRKTKQYFLLVLKGIGQPEE